MRFNFVRDAACVAATALSVITSVQAAPIANAGENQTIYLGDSTTLNGSATDPDGLAIVGWDWNVISAPADSFWDLAFSSSPQADFTADTLGDYVFTLSAWNGLAWSDLDATLVTIIENLAPTASASIFPDYGISPLTVNFDGTGSSDPEAGSLYYDWDFGDGFYGTGATLTHTYEAPGTYSGNLIVTDSYNNDDFVTFDITVSAVPVPAAVWLFSSGLICLIGVARRKKA